MDIQVSVVVPVFNVAPFLSRCIESILAQSSGGFEVVFVNDGSTDDSEAVIERAMERCVRKDISWKLIVQPNGGLSAARNAGLRAACGKYVLFVDGDDVIHPHLLEKTVEQAESHALDYVVFDHETFTDEPNGWDVAAAPPGILGQDAFEWFVSSARSPSAWRFIFRRERLGESPFVQGLVYEDNPFVFEYLNRGLRGCHLAAAYYRYRQRNGSLVKSAMTLTKVRSVNLIVRRMRKLIGDDKRFRLLCNKVLGRLVRNVVKRARKASDPLVRFAGADLAEGLLREGLLHYADFGAGWALRLFVLRIARRLTHPLTTARKSRGGIPWQYDCISSIGRYYAPAENLSRLNLGTFSEPLDRLALQPSGLAECADIICGSVTNVCREYDRRISDFHRKVTGRRALLVFLAWQVHPEDAEIWESLQKLRRKLGEGIDLLVLENLYEMRGVEFTETNPGAYLVRGRFHCSKRHAT